MSFRIAYWLLLAGIILNTCSFPQHRQREVIAIQPLGIVDTAMLHYLKTAIMSLHAIPVEVLPAQPLPAMAYEKERGRYRADLLLGYLEQCGRGRYKKIMGITGADIATGTGGHNSWGVMGLARLHASPAIISSFRVRKNVRSVQHYRHRMLTLARHELGHTWGLSHCSSQFCLMRDAKGKMNLDKADFFCKACTGLVSRL
ncbi:MAG: hypothetical protein QM781_16495 [Chitinophagaceae bacterium]